jgi:selenide,water dikinase
MLAGLPPQADPAILVGAETSDDAGVYLLDEARALVVTADFITPVLDEPYLFGQVAAANALSDVYAMGGRPLSAVALCMFPTALEREAARAILAGGQDKVREAGAALLGGHTVKSEQLLYGLSVTGVVSPRRIWRNTGARPGDRLILTKPLGSGLIINGLRMQAIDEAEARPVIERLAILNRAAAEVLLAHGDAVHAATDVTGFGLAGHALNLARGAGVTLQISLGALPRYPHVERMIEAGVTTGSTRPNRENAAPFLLGVAPDRLADQLLHDPQTSGGLLCAVDAAAADALVAALASAGVADATVIGEVGAAGPAIALVP